MDLPQQEFSPLGSVMSFLYSAYIVFNAVLSSVLGKVIDKDFVRTKTITASLRQVGGIHFSVCCGIILLATLIPRGAFAINPKRLEKQKEDIDPLDGAVLKEGGTGHANLPGKIEHEDDLKKAGAPLRDHDLA